MLATIRSRTQRVRFVALQPAALIALALRKGATQAQAETAATVAAGQAGRLLQALEENAESTLWDVVANFRKAAAAKDMGSIFSAAAEFSDKESRQNLHEVLALLARFYRDTLVTAAGASELALLRDRAGEL